MRMRKGPGGPGHTDAGGTGTMTQPVIVVDSREQEPLPIREPFERGGLYSGDYSYRGGEDRFAVERKSIADLVASVGPERDRFENELHRLRGYDFARLLVIGSIGEIEMGRYRSRMNPTAVLHSCWAFEARYRLPVVFTPTAEEGARLVERWAFWHAREAMKRSERIKLSPNETLA